MSRLAVIKTALHYLESGVGIVHVNPRFLYILVERIRRFTHSFPAPTFNKNLISPTVASNTSKNYKIQTESTGTVYFCPFLNICHPNKRQMGHQTLD